MDQMMIPESWHKFPSLSSIVKSCLQYNNFAILLKVCYFYVSVYCFKLVLNFFMFLRQNYFYIIILLW